MGVVVVWGISGGGGSGELGKGKSACEKTNKQWGWMDGDGYPKKKSL